MVSELYLNEAQLSPERACRSMSSADSATSPGLANMTSAPTLRHHQAARPPPMIDMALVSSLAQCVSIMNRSRQLQYIHVLLLSCLHRCCLLLPVLQLHLLFAISCDYSQTD